MRAALVLLIVPYCLVNAQSPPDIGNRYKTNIVMVAGGETQIGVLYADGDHTLFEQTSPVTPYPNQLNLCNHGAMYVNRPGGGRMHRRPQQAT